MSFSSHARNGFWIPGIVAVAVLAVICVDHASAAPLVIAHRGGDVETPENTASAVSNAASMGADWIEVDIRRTADGILVIMHDPTVDRTTNGTGQIKDMTFAEVSTLDAGSWFGIEWAGEPVPSLGEVFQAAVGTPILLDFKVLGIADEIAPLISAAGLTPYDVRVWATVDQEITEAQTWLPGAPIYFQSLNCDVALIQHLAESGVDGVSIAWTDLTQELVDQAHALNLDVMLWATSNLDNMQTAIDMGVDGIHAIDPRAVLVLVPEPSASLLLTVGVACLAAMSAVRTSR